MVGPRPEVPEFAFVYPEQQEVWSVRPGITDPTAIALYNEAELLSSVDDATAYYRDVLLPEKTRLYVDYIRTRDFWTDLRVIGRTLLRALKGTDEGVSLP